mmetsp:Transcript_63229/g.205149  ORF Transcript_63229/g.205149 Transcript_63229/m.205149 type:complete len:156 (-) Transcript_63229:172-639(-)
MLPGPLPATSRGHVRQMLRVLPRGRSTSASPWSVASHSAGTQSTLAPQGTLMRRRMASSRSSGITACLRAWKLPTERLVSHRVCMLVDDPMDVAHARHASPQHQTGGAERWTDSQQPVKCPRFPWQICIRNIAVHGPHLAVELPVAALAHIGVAP